MARFGYFLKRVCEESHNGFGGMATICNNYISILGAFWQAHVYIFYQLLTFKLILFVSTFSVRYIIDQLSKWTFCVLHVHKYHIHTLLMGTPMYTISDRNINELN